MKRNYTIDTLRTIAALLVILLHVSGEYVLSGMKNNTYDASFWIGNTIDSFSRICVPLFVLISGIFLIGRDEEFIQTYKKRVSRILIPLVTWSVFYLIYSAVMSYIDYDRIDINALIITTILGEPFYHMWYLYMLTGLYLITPLINNNISRVSRKNLWTISALLLVFGIINSSYDMFFNNRPIFILWFMNYLGYFLLGYLIKDCTIKISSKTLFALYLISSILISILTYYTAKHYNSLYFYEFSTPFVIIASLSIYTIFQQVNFTENLLSRISYLTLGVYLIHAVALDLLIIGLKKSDIHTLDNPLIGIPVKFSITTIISLTIAYLFYQSRFLRKMI
jgi:surface polysaccharide O-acyltransferase-like enzyme